MGHALDLLPYVGILLAVMGVITIFITLTESVTRSIDRVSLSVLNLKHDDIKTAPLARDMMYIEDNRELYEILWEESKERRKAKRLSK